MNQSNPGYEDGFANPVGLRSLQDLLRWLVLRQHWERSVALAECDCVARHWAIIPHQGEVYVEVVAGVNGQDLLHKFPGFSTLPVTPGDRTPLRAGAQCADHAFYFGPFSQEMENL